MCLLLILNITIISNTNSICKTETEAVIQSNSHNSGNGIH